MWHSGAMKQVKAARHFDECACRAVPARLRSIARGTRQRAPLSIGYEPDREA
jgi:hypothetical protein